MDVIVDNEPAPITWQERIEALEPGQSLLADAAKINVIRTKATRVKALYPERRYRTAKTEDGARIWRTA